MASCHAAHITPTMTRLRPQLAHTDCTPIIHLGPCRRSSGWVDHELRWLKTVSQTAEREIHKHAAAKRRSPSVHLCNQELQGMPP